MPFEYDKEKFDDSSISIIDAIIQKGASKKILKFATQLDDEGKPVFTYRKLGEIKLGIINGLSDENIRTYAVVHDNHTIFGWDQMVELRHCFEKRVSPEVISVLLQINENNEPIFNASQMSSIHLGFILGNNIKDIRYATRLDKYKEPIYNSLEIKEILCGFRTKLDKNIIDFYSKIDEDENPFYDHSQMRIIRKALSAEDFTIEDIEQTFGKIKNGKPLFDNEEMLEIKVYMKEANEKQVQQLKESIKEGLNYKQLITISNKNISAENMRILRSFYKLGCEPNDILRMIIYNNDYDKFKDVKYLFQCANAFDIFYEDIVDLNRSFDIDNITQNLNSLICADRNIAEDQSDIILKLLKYKMPPEQIEYITNTKDIFSYAQMEAIGIGFLSGLSQKEIEEIMKVCEITDDMTSKEMDIMTQLTFEKINEAIKTKAPNISGLDEGYDFDTEADWFDQPGVESDWFDDSER